MKFNKIETSLSLRHTIILSVVGAICLSNLQPTTNCAINFFALSHFVGPVVYIGKSVGCVSWASVEESMQIAISYPKVAYFQRFKSRASMVFVRGPSLDLYTVERYTKYSRLIGLNASNTESCERQPALWAAFLGLAGSLGICGMAFTGSLTHSALSTAALCWFGVAQRDQPHPISGNFVAPLLLFSIVSHCALLPRRSCWSPECGLLSDSASLLCGCWSNGLEWSASCAASDASGPLCSFSLQS